MITRIPVWLRPVYGPVKWHFPEFPEKIFLTFDDGPHPSSTPSLLQLLDVLKLEVTFFCLGENLLLYPELAQAINRRGHTIANHGYRHLDGWRCSWSEFCANTLHGAHISGSAWFRPPYGRLLPSYAKRLSLQGIQTVLWDVFSGDYLPSSQPHAILRRCLHFARGGSILLFHDQPGCYRKLHEVLPPLAEALIKAGLSFCALPQAPFSPARS